MTIADTIRQAVLHGEPLHSVETHIANTAFMTFSDQWDVPINGKWHYFTFLLFVAEALE